MKNKPHTSPDCACAACAAWSPYFVSFTFTDLKRAHLAPRGALYTTFRQAMVSYKRNGFPMSLGTGQHIHMGHKQTEDDKVAMVWPRLLYFDFMTDTGARWGHREPFGFDLDDFLVRHQFEHIDYALDCAIASIRPGEWGLRTMPELDTLWGARVRFLDHAWNER